MQSAAELARRDLRALPKAHLHLHLPGSIRAHTLLELSERYGINATRQDVGRRRDAAQRNTALPARPAVERLLAGNASTTDDGSFETFASQFRAALEVLRTPEDIARLMRELAEDAAADGAVWMEPSGLMAPMVWERLGFSGEEPVLELVLDAARQAERGVGVGIGTMVNANRTHPTAEAERRARLAARYAGKGVVAFGLADDETRGAAEPFAEAFAIATSAGLIAAPHAGEHLGASSVRGAVDALGATRVQHGVRAAEEPALLERLAREEITLDVCPRSNVMLGVYPRLDALPLHALLDAGVPVSLNADNPLFVGTGILGEYQLARDVFGLDDEALAHIARCSIRASGAPDSLKRRALVDIDRWLAEPAGVPA